MGRNPRQSEIVFLTSSPSHLASFPGPQDFLYPESNKHPSDSKQLHPRGPLGLGDEALPASASVHGTHCHRRTCDFHFLLPADKTVLEGLLGSR